MTENEADVRVEENPPIDYVTVVSQDTKRSAQNAPPQAPHEWACPQCTLVNPARKLHCIACFNRHPDLTTAQIVPSEDYNDDYDDDYNDYNDNLETYRFTRTDDSNENIILGTTDDGLASSQNILEAHAEEDPFQKKIRRRTRRKRRMMAGGAAAGVAAGVVIGSPVIAVAAIVGGAVGTRIVSKYRERLKDERVAIERYTMETKAYTTS